MYILGVRLKNTLFPICSSLLAFLSPYKLANSKISFFFVPVRRFNGLNVKSVVSGANCLLMPFFSQSGLARIIHGTLIGKRDSDFMLLSSHG